MTKRERWIVYPLLIFAVVSTLFRQMSERRFAKFGTIHCEEVVVGTSLGTPRLVMKASPKTSSGLITIYGTATGLPHGLGDLNSVRTEIGADSAGGFVRIVGGDGVPTLHLGHQDGERSSGLVATDQLGALLAKPADGEEPAEVWGARIQWEHVPSAARDYEEAKAALQSQSANEESDDKSVDESVDDESPDSDATIDE